MAKVKFQDWYCEMEVKRYLNGNTAIQLWNEEEGPIATATVNLGEKLPRNQAYIKDYSENTGMLDALKEAGIVKKVVSMKQSGWVMIPLCELDLEKLGVTQ
jgi:hypothetical protein